MFQQMREISVYLRAWQDFDHHTLILKKSDTSGVKQVGWRVSSEKALKAFERQFKDMGIDHKWVEAGKKKAQGDSIQFRSPAGLPVELVLGERKVCEYGSSDCFETTKSPK